jgi:YidC/Oxa1 family membrane protein insertase
MDNQKRLLLAIGLSLGLTLVYSKLVWEPQADASRKAAEEAALLADAGTPDAVALLGADAGTTVAAAMMPLDTAGGLDAGAVRAELPRRELEFNRESARYTFSTEGAGLAHAPLLGKKEREQQQVSIAEGFKKLVGGKIPDPPQMDLAQPVNGQPLPFAVTIAGPQPVLGATRYEVVDETDGHLVFRAQSGPWQIEKTFTWKKPGYELGLQVAVKNVSAAVAQGELGLHTSRAIDANNEHSSSMFGGVGNESNATCLVGEDIQRKRPSDKPPEEFRGQVHFFGIDQQYFLAALFPVGAAREGRCVLTANASARMADAFFPLSLQPGETTTLQFGGYIGPKDLEMLASVVGPASAAGPGSGAVVSSPGLEKTVDFGWWAVICKVLLTVLKFFHKLVGNWGLAIILLTVSVKLLLLPLTHKAMVSAESMKKLQPKMEELKKKFPDDKERQNVEMMKLYQEQKVNPLGGCLPLLLQLPIWAALFTTLRTSYEVYGEPFFGPVWTDLTYKDPTYLLPLALGITMVITQRAQPQMMDAAQAKLMTWFMPIFFTAMMMNYPAGLALYIFTNNLLSIAQQAALKRYLASRASKGGTGGTPSRTDDDKKLQATSKA